MSDKLSTMLTQAELEKIHVEINKMMAETVKLQRENAYYPLVVGASAALALVAIVKLFI